MAQTMQAQMMATEKAVLSRGAEIPLFQCDSPNCCSGKVHCPLCPTTLYSPKSFADVSHHIAKEHLSKGVELPSHLVLPCNQPCANTKFTHFHCPTCCVAYAKAASLTKHSKGCSMEKTSLWEALVADDSDLAKHVAKEVGICLDAEIPEPDKIHKHPSLVQRLTDVVAQRCEECCTLFHCPFCPKECLKAGKAVKIAQHILASHWKRRYTSHGLNILKCTMKTCLRNPGRVGQSHYHCPLCKKLMLTLKRLEHHLQCHKKGTVHKDRIDSSNANQQGEEIEHEIVAANYTVPLSLEESLGNNNIITDLRVAPVIEGALEIEMEQQEMPSDSAILVGLETPVHEVGDVNQVRHIDQSYAGNLQGAVTVPATDVQKLEADITNSEVCVAYDLQELVNSAPQVIDNEAKIVHLQQYEDMHREMSDEDGVPVEIVLVQDQAHIEMIEEQEIDEDSQPQRKDELEQLEDESHEQTEKLNFQQAIVEQQLNSANESLDQSKVVLNAASGCFEEIMCTPTNVEIKKERPGLNELSSTNSKHENTDQTIAELGLEEPLSDNPGKIFDSVGAMVNKDLLDSLPGAPNELMTLLNSNYGVKCKEMGDGRICLQGKWWQISCAYMALEEAYRVRPTVMKELVNIFEGCGGKKEEIVTLEEADEAAKEETKMEINSPDGTDENAQPTQGEDEVQEDGEKNEGNETDDRPRKRRKITKDEEIEISIEDIHIVGEVREDTVASKESESDSGKENIKSTKRTRRSTRRKVNAHAGGNERCNEDITQASNMDKAITDERVLSALVETVSQPEAELDDDESIEAESDPTSKQVVNEVEAVGVDSVDKTADANDNQVMWDIKIQYKPAEPKAAESDNIDTHEAETNVEVIAEEPQETALPTAADNVIVQGTVTDLEGYTFDEASRTCALCEQTFPTRPLLLYHLLNDPSCKNFKLKFFNARLKEMLTRMNRVKNQNCPSCNTAFAHINDAKVHCALRICKPPRHPSAWRYDTCPETGLLMCDEPGCKYKGKTPAHVDQHKGNRHAAKDFPCLECNHRFGSEAILKRHVKFIHENTAKSVCHICGKEMLTKYMSRHVKAVHTGNPPAYLNRRLDKPVVCTYEGCSYSSYYADVLQKHVKRIHGVKDKMCTICGAAFAFVGDLNAHKKLHLDVPERKEIKCGQCGKVMLKQNLAVHIKTVHQRKRQFSCALCRKSFTTKYVLNCHLETHKKPNERSYKFVCSYCGAGFINKTIYNDHLNTHTGNRPYKCPTCSKAFKQTSVFHKHLEIHSNIKYFCALCNEMYPNKTTYSHHKQTVHSNTFLPCFCKDVFPNLASLHQHQAQCETAQASLGLIGASDGGAGEAGTEAATQAILAGQAFMIEANSASEGEVDNEQPQEVSQVELQPGPSLVTLEDGTLVLVEEDLNVSGGAVQTNLVPEILYPQAITEGNEQDGSVIKVMQDPATGIYMANVAENSGLEATQQVDENDSFQCGYCQTILSSLEHIQQHILEEHSEIVKQETGVSMESVCG